jgi:hypothetical protein
MFTFLKGISYARCGKSSKPAFFLLYEEYAFLRRLNVILLILHDWFH